VAVVANNAAARARVSLTSKLKFFDEKLTKLENFASYESVSKTLEDKMKVMADALNSKVDAVSQENAALRKTQLKMENELEALRHRCRTQADHISNLEVDIKSLNKRVENAKHQIQSPSQFGILETRIDRVQVCVRQLERMINAETDSVCDMDYRVQEIEERVSKLDGIIVEHEIEEDDDEAPTNIGYTLSPTAILAAKPKKKLDVIPRPVFNTPAKAPEQATSSASLLSISPSLQSITELFHYYCHYLNDININFKMWEMYSDDEKLTHIRGFWITNLSKLWLTCGSNIRDYRKYGGEDNKLNFEKFLKNFNSRHLKWDVNNLPPYPKAAGNAKNKKKRKKSRSLKE